MNQDKKLKVLLVDDNDVILSDIYGRKFRAAGCDFTILSDAEGDFARIVADIQPSVILMDIDLKKPRTGVDAVKILQADERTKSIPVIFLTNGDMLEEAKEAKQMPFLGFIIKADLIPSEVVSKVQELYGEFLNTKKS